MSPRPTSPAALWCGLAPLVAGVLSLLLYWWFRHRAFVTLGLGVLALAPFAWLAGMFLVLRRGPRTGPRRTALWVLVADLPAAVICAALGLHLMAQNRVLVHNRSAQTLEQVHLDVTGLPRIELGSLAPGTSRVATFVPQTDGRVRVRFVAGGRTHDGEVLGYVTRSPLGAEVTTEIAADLAVHSTERPH